MGVQSSLDLAHPEIEPCRFFGLSPSVEIGDCLFPESVLLVGLHYSVELDLHVLFDLLVPRLLHLLNLLRGFLVPSQIFLYLLPLVFGDGLEAFLVLDLGFIVFVHFFHALDLCFDFRHLASLLQIFECSIELLDDGLFESLLVLGYRLLGVFVGDVNEVGNRNSG